MPTTPLLPTLLSYVGRGAVAESRSEDPNPGNLEEPAKGHPEGAPDSEVDGPCEVGCCCLSARKMAVRPPGLLKKEFQWENQFLTTLTS